ncbi:MAG: amidohydrolase family protein, partial [Thermoanaerobaculia bacterium]|nr:amidohydrolase family protein [Thermoanaerobaculia bacterium]
IEAARQRGMLSVVHATILSRAQTAIEDGANGLAHLFSDVPPTAEFIALMAERKAFVIPTLTVVESTTGVASGASLIDDERLAPYLTKQERSNLGQAFPAGHGSFEFARSTVAQLHAVGVPILAGSDAPNPATGYGSSLHRELELLVAAGLSPAEALASATAVPASVFSLDDRGRIAPGLRADLVLVAGDPTTDITASRDIRQVWKGGSAVQRPLAIAGEEAAASNIPESGLIADFSTGELTATFGAGWEPSTDTLMGGTSTVDLTTITVDTPGDHALAIAGTIRPGFAFPWSGAMFFPGESQMKRSNLSEFSGIAFRAKSGSEAPGGSFRIMVFAESLGMRPAEQRFSAGTDWSEHNVPFSDFGIDGTDVTGIFFGAGPAEGDFLLLVDDVRLVAID